MGEIIVKRISEDEVSRRGIDHWGIWEREPSEFDWAYTNEEHCYIIEGRATVKTGNETVEINQGDYVIFPAGLKCRWKITESIKKYYDLR